MKCSLNDVTGWILAAITALAGAITLAMLWPTAYPLFAAAALVATVAFVLIPKIKSGIQAYVACRGASNKCAPSITINNLGQVAATISAISFALAGALQIGALAAFASFFLGFLGVIAEVAVVALVHSGEFACAIGALLLLGVLTDAYSYKSCMDRQQSSASIAPTSGDLSL